MHDITAELDSHLLVSIAEQLKIPLTTIARQADLALLTGKDLDIRAVQVQSVAAVSLVDNYLLGLQLLAQQQPLALEPVSITSTLVDIAHGLDRFAQLHNVRIETAITGRFVPVMANRVALKVALSSMGFSLIEMAAQHAGVHPVALELRVYRTPKGTMAGWYGLSDGTATDWQQAKKLRAQAVQPLRSLGSSAAGMFVADALLQAMDTTLKVRQTAGAHGFSALFQPSRQLQLV